MDTGKAFKKRYKLYRQIAKITESVRGSLVIMERYCGKSNCHCRKGHKHKAVYLSQSHNGKTRMIYIPENMKEKASEYIQNYHRIRNALNKISDINIKLLTERKITR